MLGLVLVGLSPAASAPFDCATNHCGIGIDAPYPNIVIGKIDGIASPSQAETILLAAQKEGLWRVFPADPATFASKIQIISIRVAPGKSLTVLASVEEQRYSGLKIGSFARFAPHRGLHVKPRPGDPYWVGIGCVVLLCFPQDQVCPTRYDPGIYRLSDGAELDASGKHIVAGGIVIDTMSMEPKTNEHSPGAVGG